MSILKTLGTISQVGGMIFSAVPGGQAIGGASIAAGTAMKGIDARKEEKKKQSALDKENKELAAANALKAGVPQGASPVANATNPYAPTIGNVPPSTPLYASASNPAQNTQNPGMGGQGIWNNVNASATPLSNVRFNTGGVDEPFPPALNPSGQPGNTFMGPTGAVDQSNTNMPINTAGSINNDQGLQPDKSVVGSPANDTGQYSQWANALAYGQQALNAGSTIWNATRKPNMMPDPEKVSLDRVNYNTGELQQNLSNQRTGATANALYSARGMGVNTNQLTGIYGNQMAQAGQDAMQVEQIKNQERNTNAQIQHQETSLNSDVNNRFALANAEYLNNFDMQRGQAISQGVSNVGQIERDRMNTQLGLNTMNRFGSMQNAESEYAQWSMKPDDPNNPLRKADGSVMTLDEYINSTQQNAPLWMRGRR